MRLGLGVAALAVSLLTACGDVSPATLEFVSLDPPQPRLGESTSVRFRALDGHGDPMPGVTVTFELTTPSSGVELQPRTGITDKTDGTVATTVIATTRASSTAVRATAGTKTATSPSISFNGGSSPSGRQLTFQCGPIAGAGSGGIHAIGAYDETRYLIAGEKLQCTAHVADHNGNGLPGAVVSFLAEAGAIGPSETSKTDVIGNATILYKTAYPLPRDVPPGTFTFAPLNDATHTGELLAPMWMHPFDWVRNPVKDYALAPTLQEPRRPDPIRPGLTLNPRDNLVTLIAMTLGEEGYTDQNNNGQYDDGEPFDDLTEPFVDANDDGTWEPDEPFVDVNGNGKWDGKNGVYDSSTIIWTQERILWTGVPHAADLADVTNPVWTRLSPPPANNIVIPHFGSVQVQFLLSDPWFNAIAQNGAADGCKLDSAEVRSPVLIAPSVFGVGIPLTYPPFRLFTGLIVDTHDPTVDPPPPPYSSAVDFTANFSCSFTSSPDEGNSVTVGFGTTGQVY